MTLEAIYFLTQIIAALAIIGSLVFVGLQIRANTREHRVNTYNMRSERWSAINNILSSNSDLREILVKGGKSYDGLTTAEKIAFAAFWQQYCSYIIDVATQHELGAIDDVIWKNYEFSFRQFCRMPGARAWWRDQGHKFFAAYPNSVLGPIFDPSARKARDDA